MPNPLRKTLTNFPAVYEGLLRFVTLPFVYISFPVLSAQVSPSPVYSSQ